MDSSDSQLRGAIDPVMAAVSVRMNCYADPNGPFPPMPTLIGIEEIRSQDAPPNVVWVPKTDDGYHVAHEHPDDGIADYQTWTTCEVHCWGKDLAQAERLRSAVLSAGKAVWSGNAFKPVSKGTYSKGVVGQNGVEIVLSCAFNMLILQEEWIPVTVVQVNAGPPTAASDNALVVIDPSQTPPAQVMQP